MFMCLNKPFKLFVFMAVTVLLCLHVADPDIFLATVFW